ncbi:hypothetical protein SMICM304S_01366 [Streptomyces microflavus]
MYDPTVARLTYRALLGRRRAAILFVLPALLLVIAAAVRMFAGADDQVAANVLGGFAIATMVPLIGVIAGTGAIGPEIDDGSIVYLLAKPVKRPTIIFTKLIVAIAVTMVFSALPTLLAGLILNGNGQRIAIACARSRRWSPSIAYSALFLLLGTISRHAVVIGLVARAGLGSPLRSTWCRARGRSASSSGPFAVAGGWPARAWSPRRSDCRSRRSCWPPSPWPPPGTRARSCAR